MHYFERVVREEANSKVLLVSIYTHLFDSIYTHLIASIYTHTRILLRGAVATINVPATIKVLAIMQVLLGEKARLRASTFVTLYSIFLIRTV